MARSIRGLLLLAVFSLCTHSLMGQGKGTPKIVELKPPPDELRKNLKLSEFYQKHISDEGLPIVGSKIVSDDALREATRIVNKMLTDRDDVRQALIKNKVRVAVMAKTEKTTDIPEHSDLTPKDHWDKRARGLGATFARLAISCAEENLLNLKGDPYTGENILVHEFAHTFHELGINSIDKTFEGKLKAAYQTAMDRGLWKNTYAATNHKEYWAEGVQSYFDCNTMRIGLNIIVNKREQLAKYDPTLFKMIDDEFRKSKWRYTGYDKRKSQAGIGK